MLLWKKLIQPIIHRKRNSAYSSIENPYPLNILHTPKEYLNQNILSVFIHISKYYFLIINNLLNNDKFNSKDLIELNQHFFIQQAEKLKFLDKAPYHRDIDVKKLVVLLDKLHKQFEILCTNSIKFSSKDKGLDAELNLSINTLLENFTEYMNFAIHGLHASKKEFILEITVKYEGLVDFIGKLKKKLVKQTQNKGLSLSARLFYIKFISDTENIVILLQKILLKSLP